jgi:hypothetical protein
MSQKKPSCAVIMSGHARMVPQGMHMLQDRFDTACTAMDYTVFSNVWTDSSESRPKRTEQELQQQADALSILSSLGSRHRVIEQRPVFEPIYEKFLLARAIPTHEADSRGFRMPRDTFYRFMGQVMGFVLALDHWRQELAEYDYIVRSRWDMCLDSTVLDELAAPQRYIGEFETFYTKSVEIVQGSVQISGDTIYGRTEQWLESFSDFDHVVDRILTGTKLRWQDIQRRYRANWSLHGDYEKYYLTGWWFNSHFIWTTLFDSTDISVRAKGESFGISSSAALIPVEQLKITDLMGVARGATPEEIQQVQYTDTVKKQQALQNRERLDTVNQTLTVLEQQRIARAESIRRRMDFK